MRDDGPAAPIAALALISIVAVVLFAVIPTPAKVVEVRGSMTVVSTSGSSYPARLLQAPTNDEPNWVVHTVDNRRVVLTGAPTVVIDSETVQRFGEEQQEEPTDG
jgi:hypothetical protein